VIRRRTSGRALLVSLLGIILVPLAAYRLPYLSPWLFTPIAALLAFGFIWLKPARPDVELGLRPPPHPWAAILIGAAVGVALVVTNRLLLTPLIELLAGVKRDLGTFDYLRGHPQALLQLLPLVWLSAGLCEEVVYRGYVLTQSAALLGNSGAARAFALIVSTILFALAHWHQGPSGMVVTGIVAIILGLLFLRQRQNLWANVAAHITADTVSLVGIAGNWDRWLEQIGR
jgi:membrane protease YdiL (CAAX protease family)